MQVMQIMQNQVAELHTQILRLQQRVAKLEIEAGRHKKQLDVLGCSLLEAKCPLKPCVLSRLEAESYYDRGAAWEEHRFVPYEVNGEILSFDTPEEAQEYVYEHADEFQSRVYCHSTATRKVTKLRKKR